MAWILLQDKNKNKVAENTNFRIEQSGQLHLPREINHNGALYRFDHYEGKVAIYIQQ